LRGWLLDTNVISEPLRPRPNNDVVDFIAAQSEDSLFISIVSFVEIRYGLEQVTNPAREEQIRLWLDRDLRPRFKERALLATEDILLAWRRLMQRGRASGRTFSPLDSLIAAQAQLEDLIIVSRNVSDFVHAGVSVFNPWNKSYIAASGKARTIQDPAAPDLLSRL